MNDVKTILEHEDEVPSNISVSIFRVQPALSATKPEAYTPQVIGLGPYHHCANQLYEMERLKLANTRPARKRFQIILKQLVENLKDPEIEFGVRASYHKYLDMDSDTLLWIMAIDGLFLLHLLFTYTKQRDGLSSACPITAHLLDPSGSNKLVRQAIISDIMMLENQIPFFLLQKILSFHPELSVGGSDSDGSMDSMLLCFCDSISPIKLKRDGPVRPILQSNQVFYHLLDLLYRMIVHQRVIDTDAPCQVQIPSTAQVSESPFQDQPAAENTTQVFCDLYKVFSSLNIRWVKKLIKPLKVISGVPWKEVSKHLPIAATSDHDEDSCEDKQIPNVEEIYIPSVSSLIDAGVEFFPTHDGIGAIKFDSKKRRLDLPVINLDVNSEVIIRNLVAYESSVVSGPLVFTRYTELMTGIIDTAEDAMLLRKKKIIRSCLKSDADIADIFNGISKSVRLTKVQHIDEAIQGVNKYYKSTARVRVYECTKKYVYGSWRILTLMAAILLMLLMALQSFCSVYNCPRLFNMDYQIGNIG